MTFTSFTFMLFFLPIVVVGNYFLPKNIRPIFLTCASYFFYFWGSPAYFVKLLILHCSVIVAIILIRQFKKYKKGILILSISFIILNLCYFKYFNSMISGLGLEDQFQRVVFPLGLSFISFQSIGMIVDVYLERVCISSYRELFLFLSFFPSITSGPILRGNQIIGKEADVSSVHLKDGLILFVFGLSKKVLLADQFALVSRLSFEGDMVNMSWVISWLGLIAYVLQIYYDFSGYSDMAIGISKMFGYQIPANFNYPYISKSVSEFWRRWHISLSSWFRDYIYIPLGGNRKGQFRLVLNTMIVWCLTGIWHGTGLNFLLWGCYFGVLILFEKFVLKKVLDKLPSVLQHVYTMLAIAGGWILFRCTSLIEIFRYAKGLLRTRTVTDLEVLKQLDILYLIPFFAAGVLLCSPWWNKTIQKLLSSKYKWIVFGFLFILVVMSISVILTQSYSPFIYVDF